MSTKKQWTITYHSAGGDLHWTDEMYKTKDIAIVAAEKEIEKNPKQWASSTKNGDAYDISCCVFSRKNEKS